MNNRSRLVCLLAILFLGSCDYVFPHTWRYRITVDIETPEGIKTGMAVREVRAQQNIAQWLNPDVKSITNKVIGEAVVINLEKRGVVFALIKWDSYEEFYKAFPNKYETWTERIQYYDALESGTKSQLHHKRPQLIYFSNINDPTTLKSLSYGTLSSEIGENVKIKNVSVEITEDQISNDVGKWLEILYADDKFTQWKKSLNYGDPRQVTGDNFRRGIIEK